MCSTLISLNLIDDPWKCYVLLHVSLNCVTKVVVLFQLISKNIFSAIEILAFVHGMYISHVSCHPLVTRRDKYKTNVLLPYIGLH